MKVRACPVPHDALLQRYVERSGAYTDCFEVGFAGEADLSAFLNAFYTTWLFRLERTVLTLVLRRRIRDIDVAALAQGRADTFAVWKVEAREAQQILLCDNSGATRSFLRVVPEEGGKTQLLFGSAVVGKASGPSFLVRVTVPLLQFYSRALLRLAERRLRQG